MYSIKNGKFYSIPGGYINIPQPYKSRDKDNNLVVSAQFFKDYPDFFEKDGKKLNNAYGVLKSVDLLPCDGLGACAPNRRCMERWTPRRRLSSIPWSCPNPITE